MVICWRHPPPGHQLQGWQALLWARRTTATLRCHKLWGWLRYGGGGPERHHYGKQQTG